MKSKKLRIGLAVSVFFLIFVLASVLTIPLYRNITAAMSHFEEKYLVMLEENTGMKIRYGSFSPSIISGIKVRNIEVYDASTEKVLISIRKASIGYSLHAIIHRDMEKAFRALSINDVTINYNEDDYPEITEKMLKLLNQNPEEQQKIEITDQLINQVKDMLFIIPFGVQIRNISFTMDAMKSLGLDAEVKLEKTEIRKEAQGKAITAILRGHVLAEPEALGGKTAGLTLELNCKILDRIEDSSIIVGLGDYSPADYSIKKMEFLLRYGDSTASINSIQQLIPYIVSASYNLKEQTLTAEIETEKLDPFALLRTSGLPQEIRNFKGSLITVKGGITLKTEDLTMNWNARGEVSLSEKILGSVQKAGFNLSGTEKDIYINSITADGYILGASGSGRFNIPRLEPQLTLSVDHLRIPGGNDNAMSMEIYLDSYDGSYSLFIPQLFLGDKYFTAIQGDVELKDSAVDFSLSLGDYSHADYSTPGEISIDGSYIMGKKNVVEVMASINSFFLDSIAETAAFFLDENTAGVINGLLPTLRPFIMSTEVYLSTDMESVSFNSPYSIIANTEADRQMLVLSFDGNESAVYVTQLDLVYDSITFQGNADVDLFLDENQVVFSTSFNVNNIPYHLEGSVNNGQWVSVTGDYGLDVLVNIGKTISGNLSLSQLPVAYEDFLFYFNARLNFSYSMETDSFFDNPLTVKIEDLGVEEASGTITFNPKLSLMGIVDNDGFVIQSLSYSDTTSALEGSGYAMWNLDGGSFKNLNVNFLIKNPISPESVRIDGSITNTFAENTSFSLENILKYSIDMQMEINGLDMGRFLEYQDPEDTLNATVSATGTLENPSVIVNIRRVGVNMNGMVIFAQGSVNLQIISEDQWYVDISGINANCAGVDIKDLTGSLELTGFEGKLHGTVSAAAMGEYVLVPFDIGIQNLSPKEPGKLIPDTFRIDFDSQVEISLLDEPVPVHLEMIRYPGTFIFNTDDTLKTSGYMMDNGDMSINIDPSMPLHFNFNGNFIGKSMDVTIKNMYCDVAEFAQYINSGMFSLYSGLLKGELHMWGLQKDPSIKGNLALTNLDFNLPDYIPEHFTCRGIFVDMDQENITVPETDIKVKDADIKLKASMIFNCLSIENLKVDINTSGKKGIPLDVKIPLVRAKGNLGLAASVTLDSEALDVDAKVKLDNSEVTLLDLSSGLDLSMYTGNSSGKDKSSGGISPFDVRVNAQLTIGEKVQFVVNPVLRGIIAQNQPLNFILDTGTEEWALNGNLTLKGGEVTYFNRNFYIKEGEVDLNETNTSLDPVVSFRAETREQTNDGSPVTLVLSAQNQRISKLDPKIYSIPSKSEKEIMELLGSVFTADSSTNSENMWENIIVSGVDYGVQVTVMRKLENALRDLLNFDIFSVRSSVLQNVMKYGLDNFTTLGSSSSNYFDYSTVYIGKYIGDFVYADATLHWFNDDNFLKNGMVFAPDVWLQGFKFQPEIGLEFESPFANIRWSMAPDWSHIQDTMVSSTAITLSWRITF